MRIISGKFKGRRFDPPANKWPTRPTTDYAKEGLFNILNNLLDYEMISALDLFGGTGSHSYELISRGCGNVTYVELHRGVVSYVRSMAEKLDITDRLLIRNEEVRKFLRRTNLTYDYIFAGPPYPLPWLFSIPELIFDEAVLAQDGILVLEHNPSHDFSQHPKFWQLRKYGKTYFSFFTG